MFNISLYLSITTFLGGGGKHLPEILIILRPSVQGAFGGASLITFVIKLKY